MKMSPEGVALLTELEGCRLAAYKDVAGFWTIGIGHLLTRSEVMSGKIIIGLSVVKWREGITQKQAEQLLYLDLYYAVAGVNQYNQAEQLNQHQFDALVSFAFNVGVGAFNNSTLAKCLRAGDLDAVPGQLRRWVKAGGKTVKGLVVRREKEVAMWLGNAALRQGVEK
jgi:lysozyme